MSTYAAVPTPYVRGIVTAIITCCGKGNSMKTLIGACILAMSHIFLIINKVTKTAPLTLSVPN
jgi:hypothetical protein